MTQARRYNKGKLNYNLGSTFAERQVAKVSTLGAHKYSIYKDEQGNEILGKDISFEEAANLEIVDSGEMNWTKGMPWTKVMESVERHIQDWKNGIDFDEDLGTYNLANAIWGLDKILDFYQSHPNLDDRKNTFFDKRVGLDLDGVMFDYSSAFCEWAGIEDRNNHWLFSYVWEKRHRELYSDKDFWVNLKPLQNPDSIPFDPVCYCTTRHIPTEWSEEAIEKAGYPCAPVYTVQDSKVEVLKNMKLDIFVDDYFSNFAELNNAGIFTYLYDRPYNRKFEVGHKRIHSLNDIVNKK